jgi:hypothetical protein
VIKFFHPPLHPINEDPMDGYIKIPITFDLSEVLARLEQIEQRLESIETALLNLSQLSPNDQATLASVLKTAGDVTSQLKAADTTKT